ncbi:MAG TPA: hypothetical protein VJ825_03805 [Gemmatimonadaceae bacterium]|nr:hypothetical protein [Gemmatimonadaceae bacterium]
MNLSCKTILLATLASALACSDSTGPKTVEAQFVLHDIGGRLLPTYPAATPGLTPTILDGTVTLYSSGQATIFEHRTEWNGVDATYTTPYTYKIRNNVVEFAPLTPCPPAAICAGPPAGTLSLTLGRMSLNMGGAEFPIIYNYDRVVSL